MNKYLSGLIVLLGIGLVGCSKEQSNIWICDSKDFAQDQYQSWADRTTLMRFIFDFKIGNAAFMLVSYPRLMDYVSIEDWHIVNQFLLEESNETSLHQQLNEGVIDIKFESEDKSVLRFSALNVKTNNWDAFKLVKQESNENLAQWDDSMATYNCIKKDIGN